MAVEFRLPDVGEGIHEAEIVRWLVQEGERVKEFDPIVEIQTDKAVVELPAPTTGFIGEIRATPGNIAHVGDVLVVIETAQGGTRDLSRSAIEGTRTPAHAGVGVEAKTGSVSPANHPQGVESVPRPRATPGVRHYARSKNVVLSDVVGSGPGGRIQKSDVDRYVETKKALDQAPSRQIPEHPGPDESPFLWTALAQKEREAKARERVKIDLSGLDDAVRRPVFPNERSNFAQAEICSSTKIPFRGIRRATAEHVKRSAFSAPHVTAFDDCDASNLIKLRSRWNELLEGQGQRISYLPFLIKATVSALKAFPYFNARLNEAEQEIELLANYHIGIAMDTPDGLLVPVVRHADQLTVREIGEEIYRLTQGAKARTLKQDELRGSTFTISNMGPLGGMFATPILNYPEVGILAVHQIQKKPVVRDDEIVIREMLTLSLSFDHRVIDGASSVRFMNHLRHLIEQPESLMLELK